MLTLFSQLNVWKYFKLIRISIVCHPDWWRWLYQLHVAKPFYRVLYNNPFVSFLSGPSVQFLWPFQSFSQSKGRHALKHNGMRFGIDVDTIENDAPFSGLNANAFVDNIDNVTVSSAALQESIKFEWMVSPWSECSQSCGPDIGYRVSYSVIFSTGNLYPKLFCHWFILRRELFLTCSPAHHHFVHLLQFRRTQCLVRLDNVTQDVDSILCKDARLSEPDSFEKCGGQECARWTPGEWTSCSQSRCQSQNTAVQHRTVQCLFSNGTENEKACDFNERPIEQQECYKERCKTVWQTGNWSDVSCRQILF